MFQFRRFPAYAYLIQRTLTEYCSAGFPHSEICGSKLICSSPQLIAACHVLLRLLMPRHSPCALISLTIFWFSERIMQVTEVFISRSNCSFTHNSTKNLFAPPFGEAPSVALLIISSFSIVQFSRCRQKIHFHVPSKLNKVRSPRKD